MKTYSELKDVAPIDWNKQLDIMISGEGDNYQGMAEQLTDRAGSWVTCACGNQCDIIPRRPDGQPFDELLASMGDTFYLFVKGEKWQDAKDLLFQIEERSELLIRRLEANSESGHV